MSTLMEKIKPVVLFKYEIECLQKSKGKSLLLNFRTVMILMEGRKTMSF